MSGVDDHSEFEGGGVMPNTVFPKSPEYLSNSEKLRLDAITGQHEDGRAPVNPFHWTGNSIPDPAIEAQAMRERQAQARAIRQQAKARYRESKTYGLN
jgi:hypothetical protein